MNVMTRHRLVFAVVLALSVPLAGCSALDAGGTPTATTTGGENGTVPDGVSDRAAEAIESVETYRVDATETRTIVGAQTQVIEIEQSADVDRTDHRLHRAGNQSVGGRTVAVDTYLVNETVYQRSPAFVRQFSAEWIEVDTGGNFTRAFEVADPINRHHRVLETASFAADGTETIAGKEAYRIETESDPERLEDLFAELIAGPTSGFNESTYSLNDATYTFWIDAETDRPLRVAGSLESQVASRGRQVTLQQSFTFAYDYESAVSIDLPEAASNAVSLSGALNGTSPGP
jgi:hypothetical protein